MLFFFSLLTFVFNLFLEPLSLALCLFVVSKTNLSASSCFSSLGSDVGYLYQLKRQIVLRPLFEGEVETEALATWNLNIFGEV